MDIFKKNMEYKISATTTLFKLYIDYLSVDLSNFFRNDSNRGRNIHVILSFVDILLNIDLTDVFGETLLETNKKELKLLEVFIDKFLATGRNLTNIKKENINVLCVAKILEDEDLFNLFREAKFAGNYFRKVSKKPYMKDFKQYCNSEKPKGFTQSVLELHNALSHLAIFLLQDDQSDLFNNIDKAKNHIYRSILDYYKIMIRFSINEIQQKDLLTQSFYSIREQEFLFLGQDLKHKKINFFNPQNQLIEKVDIIKAYKTLFNTINNILDPSV
ncbi:hypothetical protein [Campylobacter lari]|uniref:Uncharacterized protein n=1 Tax=Campylobacter lari TaxID=201 RepID=A0A825SMN4_CAMLA|nr:hypothetical protein [Campylobacter lari]EAK0451775.1 hypothetical protein [Campylobacter lari]EAK9869872.1 hypothetical protein [Campylobacter lari]MPB17173.1 hypothetical protein [Campylobacter lari]